MLRFWLSKKGYDYYKASTKTVRLKGKGMVHRNLAVRTGRTGKRMVRALEASPGRSGAVRVLIKNVDTGTQMAISMKAFCGRHPCGTR